MSRSGILARGGLKRRRFGPEEAPDLFTLDDFPLEEQTHHGLERRPVGAEELRRPLIASVINRSGVIGVHLGAGTAERQGALAGAEPSERTRPDERRNAIGSSQTAIVLHQSFAISPVTFTACCSRSVTSAGSSTRIVTNG